MNNTKFDKIFYSHEQLYKKFTSESAIKKSRTILNNYIREITLISEKDQDIILAKIEGSNYKPYSVKISTNGKDIQYFCNCPHETGQDYICKHIGASLLACLEGNISDFPDVKSNINDIEVMENPYKIKQEIKNIAINYINKNFNKDLLSSIFISQIDDNNKFILSEILTVKACEEIEEKGPNKSSIDLLKIALNLITYYSEYHNDFTYSMNTLYSMAGYIEELLDDYIEDELFKEFCQYYSNIALELEDSPFQEFDGNNVIGDILGTLDHYGIQINY